LTARLLREPLLQFLLIGALLFTAYGLLGKPSGDPADKIIVSASRVANLGDGFARTWRRPPSEQELQGLIEDYVRDEVYYREGRAAGLDRDDVIIRRRMRQKMEFFAEEMTVPEPTAAQLEDYLASNADRFRAEGQITFRQIFLSATRRPTTIASDSRQVASILTRDGASADITAVGDSFLLGDDFRGVSQSEVARLFGEGFADWIFALETGRWQGPAQSSFGQHFVLIDEVRPGRLPALNDIRPAVRREWASSRRLEAEQKFYASLRARYDVVIESLGGASR